MGRTSTTGLVRDTGVPDRSPVAAVFGPYPVADPAGQAFAIVLVPTEVTGMSGSYLHWGVVQISSTNFLIVVIMLAVFAVAVAVPMRGRRHGHDRKDAL